MDEPEVQLAVKRNKIRTINGPGLVWMLIILMLLLMAVTVIVFSKNGVGSGDVLTTPTPTDMPDITAQPQRIYTIAYKNGVFSPTNLRIHSGDTVRFKNEGYAGIRVVTDPHPEHNNLVGFDSMGDMFISVKNFDTDVSLMNSDGVSVKNVTDTERALIDMWVRENHVTLPPDLGYRYIIKEYPSKPWLNDSS